MYEAEHHTDRVRDPGLQHYLETIGRHPLLTRTAEWALAAQVRAGDRAALDQLVNANLRFVVTVAKRYVGRGLSLMDLIAEGNVGLITAARRFDERREFRFVTYAAWWIRQTIQVALSEQVGTVRLPANRVRDVHRASAAEHRLEQELGRRVTEEEIAARVDLAPRKLAQIRAAARPLVSLDESTFADGDALVDTESAGPDEQFLADEVEDVVRGALATLAPREQEVLRRYFGLDGCDEVSLETIGRDLDLSRERVRQIRNRALERLQGTLGGVRLAELV